MSTTGLPASLDQGQRSEFAAYCIGGVLSAVLTLAAFGLVTLGLIHGAALIVALALLAIAQIVVQFRFFLHIDLKKSHRDDLQLILFTALILALMVGGTIWILFNQWSRMM